MKKYLSLLVVVALFGCAGWETVVEPPVKVDIATSVDSLYIILKAQIDKEPEAKKVALGVLAEIKTKIPYLSDGQITLNDAFAEILIVVPAEYKPYIIGLKLLFNTYYGDFGKKIPSEQIKSIEACRQIILLLETKLK